MKAAVTGILSEKKDDKDASTEEWTIDELKAGKPLLVYRYLDGSMDAALESYKFSQAFEIKILAKEKVIEQLNANWRAKRSPIDPEADQKKEENQAAILFYSFTGQKLGTLDIKSRMSSRNFITTLKKYESKNSALCAKEIKRLEKIEKMKEKAEAEAEKETAGK